jgi:hypothetical protein
MLRRIILVNGDTLTLPELNNFIGRKVEITLKEFSERKEKGKSLKKYFGTLSTGFVGDALEFQKRMRAEWDEREKFF